MKIIKYALILGSLLASSTAFAQAVAVLPTQPNPPAIIATSPNETDANTVATTNKVYINQAGQNVNATIQQTGTTNVVGTLVDPIYLRGDNQTVTVIQNGNTNTLLMGVVGSVGSGSGTTTTIGQFGNNNSADIRCGTYQGDENCNGLNVNDKFVGDNNTLAFHGSASNITQTIRNAGSNNSYTIASNAPNSSQTMLVTGDYNTFNVTQSDSGGTFGHSLLVDLTGSGNNVTTQQYGPSETIINIKSVGTNGTFNIKTGH